MKGTGIRAAELAPKRIPRAPSALEERFWWLCRTSGAVPMPAREFKWHPERRWRFDFAWPSERIAVECEGGVWSGGRHTRGQGFTDDCEKYSEAAAAGWLVIRATKAQIDSGQAIAWAAKALNGR